MEKKLRSKIWLITACVSFFVLSASCKKESDDDLAIIKDGDGNEYTSVKIGAQVWLVENLKTTKLNDGTNISLITDNTLWTNATGPAYCWFNNDISNRDLYGALYNWYAVNTGKLCPAGWHVPTDEEWSELTDLFGGEAVAGGKLKATGTVEGGNGLWNSPNLNATNESGFTALPGGDRITNGFIDQAGEWGFWWTSTEYSATQAWVRDIGSDFAEISRYRSVKTFGLSVRCIKD